MDNQRPNRAARRLHRKQLRKAQAAGTSLDVFKPQRNPDSGTEMERAMHKALANLHRRQRGRDGGPLPKSVRQAEHMSVTVQLMTLTNQDRLQAANGKQPLRESKRVGGVTLHVFIPRKNTWVVLDADLMETYPDEPPPEVVLGSYASSKAANKAVEYFSKWGHRTLLRRVLPN